MIRFRLAFYMAFGMTFWGAILGGLAVSPPQILLCIILMVATLLLYFNVEGVVHEHR